MLKVYIETTVFNRFLETDREYNLETRKIFQKILENEIEAYSSTYVIEEIDKAPEPKRTEMLNLFQKYKITVLEIDKRAFDCFRRVHTLRKSPYLNNNPAIHGGVVVLSETYIEMGIIPPKYRIDGIHIAMAAINNMDCIVSLNFRHINKMKTKMATEIVHKMKGYANPFICAPMEVV